MMLVIDTATRTARIAFVQGSDVVVEQSWVADQTLSEVLVKRIEELCGTSGTTLQQVDKIIVHTGPGGFTSLRVGVVTANTLAYALNTPLIPIEGENLSLADVITAAQTAPVQTTPALPKYHEPPKITPPNGS